MNARKRSVRDGRGVADVHDDMGSELVLGKLIWSLRILGRLLSIRRSPSGRGYLLEVARVSLLCATREDVERAIGKAILTMIESEGIALPPDFDGKDEVDMLRKPQ